MIKNITFDIGNVLVDFNPIAYLDTFDFYAETKKKLNEIIFESEHWDKYDCGIYETYTDIANKLSIIYPDLAKEIKMVLNRDWVKIHYLKEGTVNLLKTLKKAGYKIYILSNISKDSYSFVSKYDFFKLVDGGVYSYNIRISKPNALIYKRLLDEYNLVPNESVFIDDRKINIEGAEKIGIKGVLFTTLNEVSKNLKSILNKEI